MTHAVILISAEREALPVLGGRLADVEGVTEAWSVTGEWDFVALIRVAQPDQLADVVTNKLGRLEGIANTYTMVAFEVFSQHDLDAMFSLGE
ncbi:MAG TPA: Lrp/AsnC ligand binding domain-containing protein [Thermoleophilaceae bacterium]|nr:Lrp/AsnC ligand binding domain-containing protein [Thermoleophilaceae bacterium]